METLLPEQDRVFRKVLARDPTSSPAILMGWRNLRTGDDIMVAGFILGGEIFLVPNTGAGRIIVRGLGPSLALAGLANPLEDPTLELRDGNGMLLIANNDWRDDPAQAAELMASRFAPLFDSESAIVASLPPGVYTALLAGLNNGTGVGLVEVYDRDYVEVLPP